MSSTMNGWNRIPNRPSHGAFTASVALHVAVAFAAWGAHRITFAPIEFVAYEINIVSIADLELPEEIALPDPDDLVVEVPDPDPPAPEPEPEPEPTPPEPEPTLPREPEPTVEPPPRDPPRPDPEPTRPAPTTPPVTEPTESTANVDLAVRMEGLQRDFPAYYGQIVAEISRCWRQPSGVERVTAIVRFEIERDGSVRRGSPGLHGRSGHGVFDIRAIEAIECAGARFAPLPGDIPGDRLPVQFTFTATGFRE